MFLLEPDLPSEDYPDVMPEPIFKAFKPQIMGSKLYSIPSFIDEDYKKQVVELIKL